MLRLRRLSWGMRVQESTNSYASLTARGLVPNRWDIIAFPLVFGLLLLAAKGAHETLYGSPEISGHECRFDLGHIIGATYRAGGTGAQATAQSERIRPWLVANRFQAISQASMTSARLGNTELASQWLRR